MEIKPVTLTVTANCSGANVSYNCIATQENIADVVFNSDYLVSNREEIVQQFFALALYDCSKLIFDNTIQRLQDGESPTSPN